VIVAGLSLRRLTQGIGNSGRNGAIAAMVVGLLVVVYAGVHVIIFPGGPGTGDGRVGAIIAIVMGLTSMILAGITLVRSRRNR
jgi:Na+/proline symporter